MLNPDPSLPQTSNRESHMNIRLAPNNVSFKYLYRDAGNYKQHGEAIFTNTTFISIQEIEQQIRST